MNRRDFLKFLGVLPFAPELITQVPTVSPTEDMINLIISPSQSISPSPTPSPTPSVSPSMEEGEDA